MPPSRRKLTLGQYVRRRNGVPMSAPGSLKNMLYRSLGARSFAVFWQYWNPIFGYLLGRFVFAPCKRVLPPALALIVTFLVCGAVHDLVTAIFRGSSAFLFTAWFFFLSLGVVASRVLRMDLQRYPWALRATTNLLYLAACLALALWLR